MTQQNNTSSQNHVCKLCVRHQTTEERDSQNPINCRGDRLEYHTDPSVPSVGLVDTKIHLNSTISDVKRGDPYCVTDIEKVYLNNNLPHFQYMRIHIINFTAEFRKKYNIDELVNSDGYVYCEIRKGMYGLKEAGVIAYQNLVKNLTPERYGLMPCTPDLWRHTRKILLSL